MKETFKSDFELDRAVRIQGTNYDRRRKVTKSMKRRMTQMHDAGKSYSVIAEYFGVTPCAVRYNLDEDYKKEINAKRKFYAHNTVPDGTELAERAAYKRGLLKNRNFRRNASVSI